MGLVAPEEEPDADAEQTETGETTNHTTDDRPDGR